MMNKPLVLTSGEWLFPIALWQLDIYSEFRKSELCDDDVAASYVYKTSDNGKTFTCIGGADVKNRTFDEHMLYEMDNGVLRMLVRLKNGIADTYSYDRGKTWSRGQTTSLGGPSSRFFIKKLKSGRVLLINHHKFTRRNNLTAFLSEDDGKTFTYSFMIDERDAVSYPDAVEMEDGSIYIVYDRERGCFKSSLEEVYASAREILTAKITEEDIINGRLTSSGSFLKRVVSKLTRLGDNVPDPFMPNMSDKELAALLLKMDDPINSVFEYFPINCDSLWEFDAKKLEMLVKRFYGSNDKSEALCDIIDYIRSVPKKSVKSFPLIEKAKSLIEAHIAQDFSITALADEMNVSVYYLAHLFKTVTGISIIEYRNELRLTKAKLLLINTDQSISDIALAVGFGSSAYFTEIFSRSERITPSEYRRIHTK
jgi:AraC-like DNA-binding protein